MDAETNIDYLWIAAQAVGFVALFCGISAFTQKSDQAFKMRMTFFCFVEALHFLLLGAYSASFGCVVNACRSFAAVHTRSVWAMIFFLALLWSLGLFSLVGFDWFVLKMSWDFGGFGGVLKTVFAEPFRILPILGSTVGTVGLFLLSGVRLRLAVLACSALWLIHNVIAVSIGPSLMEIIFIVLNAVTISKLLRAHKRAMGNSGGSQVR